MCARMHVCEQLWQCHRAERSKSEREKSEQRERKKLTDQDGGMKRGKTREVERERG